MDFLDMWQHRALFAEGMCTTVLLLVGALSIGAVGATLLATLRCDGPRWAASAIEIFIFCFQGTPFLVQLYFLYYGVGQQEWVRESVLWCIFKRADCVALLALSLNTMGYTTRLFHNALPTIRSRISEASATCGMSYWQGLHYVRLPMMYRDSYATYLNEAIFTLHATSLAGAITVTDLMCAANKVATVDYTPFEAYVMLALCYLMLSCMLTLLASLFRRLGQSGAKPAVALPQLQRAWI